MKPLSLLLLPFILLFSSCLSNPQEIEPTNVSASTPITGESTPAENPTSPPLEKTEPPPPIEPTAVLENPSTTETPLQSSLFNIPWNNREIFTAGLKNDEQDVLSELSAASDYHMKLEIEDPTIVKGQMEMRYSNQESMPLEEIYFHLFANQLGGSINVDNITVNNQPVNAEQESTALRIPLSSPLQPGQDVIIGMEFITTVPVEESTKYNILAFNDDILALAHFYPMAAVFDEEGWHIEPSPPHGDETYADMSFYLVEITAPASQVIAASGININEGESNGSQTKTIAAGPMRDFYLVMSDRFSVVSNTVGSTQINSFAPNEYMDGAQLALDVTSQALQSFGQRFGSYPYTELDIVSTPTLALGIEYPGIFANALRIYDLNETTGGSPNEIYMETTTAHEVGHQWFYNLVGNDQLNEPWLDESLTQYATWTYFIDRYGLENAQGFYNSLEGRWARNEFAEIPIGLPADAYNGLEYGSIIYGRGPIFLNELAQTIGQEPFDLFMRDYVQTYRWQIATTEDFQSLAEAHCDCDLTNLFNEWVISD